MEWGSGVGVGGRVQGNITSLLLEVGGDYEKGCKADVEECERMGVAGGQRVQACVCVCHAAFFFLPWQTSGGPASVLHQGIAGREMRGEAEGCAFKFSR